jgi:hypothetical protein
LVFARGSCGKVVDAVWPLMLLLTVAVIYHAARQPVVEPPNRHAFGCYATELAYPIRLDAAGMHILQRDFPRIPFSLERRKTGIALLAERPIAARSAGRRYRYMIERRGVGWFLNFYAVINGKRYGVFDVNDLRQFSMLTRDGSELFYRKVAPNTCMALVATQAAIDAQRRAR